MRAQMHTLEGITAAFLVILATIFVVQSVAVVPTSSAAGEGAESQMLRMSEDLLTQAHSTGKLEDAVLNWSDPTNRFSDAGASIFYQGEAPPGEFGDDLENLYSERGIAYNIDLVARRPGTNDTKTVSFVGNGRPTASAVTATQTVVLHDNDTFTGTTRELVGSNYPFDDVSSTRLYNVVEVRLTAWRK